MHSVMAVDYRIGAMTRFLALLAFLFTSFSCWGQPWPAKPVRIIAPFAPGGSADTLGRIVAQQLGERFKQGFAVEHRPGGGGASGAGVGARAAPAGYVLAGSGGPCR